MIGQILPRRVGRRTLTSATADCLRTAIHEGQFAPGHQLPAEAQLMASMGVSRSTLREALRILEDQQLIVRRRGLGTYVCVQPPCRDMSVNSDFPEMILRAGFEPGIKGQQIQVGKTHPEVEQALHLKTGELVVEIDRVLTANGNAAVWAVEYLPASLSNGSSAYVNDLGASPVLQFLVERLHIHVIRGIAHLHPINATAEAARKLHITVLQPLLSITQTDYDVEDIPIRYSIAVFAPNLLEFAVIRRGPFW